MHSDVWFAGIVLCADQNAANIRQKYRYASKCSRFNNDPDRIGGCIGLLDIPCFGHVIHNTLDHAFGFEDFVPKQHSVPFTVKDTNNYDLVYACVEAIVRAVLHSGYHVGVRPPHAAESHRISMLHITINQPQYSRARSMEDNLFTNQDIKEMALLFEEILNGCWWVDCIQHFCWKPNCKCGMNFESLVSMVVSRLTRAILERMGSRLPATNRWHTTGPQLAMQFLGEACQRIFPRALAALRKSQLFGEDVAEGAR